MDIKEPKTLLQDLSRWFDAGKKKNATHMIVVRTVFQRAPRNKRPYYDHDDHPVYVMSNENAQARVAEYNVTPSKAVLEVYRLSEDKEKQLKEHRSYNF